METSQNILSSLGGSRFVAMTGARNLVADANSLSMKLGRGAKCSHVRITLDASDTYTVETFKARGYTWTALEVETLVYVDALRDVFERLTGFACTLGTLGGVR